MNLKEKLDQHYREFNRDKIAPDPLQFLHRYKSAKDIEAAGIITSVFAYGNVTSINNTLGFIVGIAGSSPYRFITNFSDVDFAKLRFLKYRLYSEKDIFSLFSGLRDFYNQYGMIRNFFYQHYNKNDEYLDVPLNLFSLEMKSLLLKYRKSVTTGTKFMFPSPIDGSTCKRMNLFLRWMIRKDELDFGIWNKIPTSKLLIPVDTHIARICTELKLTTKKNLSWRMAEEITSNLRKFDPIDPVKYDFAICHIGIRKLDF